MKPLARFKVYPGRANDRATEKVMYWQVLVFKNHQQMRKAFHDLNVTDDTDENFGAIVMPQERQVFIKPVGAKRRRWVSAPSLGFVLFSAQQLSCEEITHEAIHMATGYLRRTRPASLNLDLEGTGDAEEDLAYAAGKCANQIVKALYRYGIY